MQPTHYPSIHQIHTLTRRQRPRYSPRPDPRGKSKTPVPEPIKEKDEDRALRSGSEEGETEED